MGDRPFRFAVQSYSARSAKQWRERAIRVEDLGYSALYLADHILGPGEAIARSGHPIQELAAVPAMAVAAEATTDLRIGCRVFCQDYRHPAMLAKEAATLDLLSEGRLELGLGAGWLQSEYEAINAPFDSAGVRVDRLGETVALVKALLGGEEVSFKGEYHRVEGFVGAPRPVQRPLPPIMIGGGAERVLSLAGREADIVSLNFDNRSGVMGPDGISRSTADATETKVRWVRDAAGDRFGDIELEIGAYFTVIGDEGRAAADGFAAVFGLSTEEMLDHPHGLFGTPETICDELLRRRSKYGISLVTVQDDVMEVFAPVVDRLSGK